MSIKPKHVLQTFKTPASRQFTDRYESVDIFEKLLLEKNAEEPTVLVYYGVGGVGKTSLRKKLTTLMTNEYPKDLWGLIDFDVVNYRNPETALYILRKDLSKDYKIQFPIFDLAYSIYWKKVNPNIPFNQNTMPLLEEGGIVADIFAIIGDVPVIGLVPKILNLTFKGKEAVVSYIHSMKNELFHLQHIQPNEIIDRLPLYLASDLKRAMGKKEKKLVIFFDTYEALWDGKKQDGQFFQQDEWIRELIAQLPEVFWVILGREKLKWSVINKDWSKYTEQHLIGKLSAEDCRVFLQSCGVIDNEIQDVIVESSLGLPYYLDISVDTYEKIIHKHNRQPVIEDFGRTNVELFERFMKYLDKNEVETLKVLSATRFWDKEIFNRLVEKFQTGYPLTAMDSLFDYSFINETDSKTGLKTWNMHGLMRKSLQEYQSSELLSDIHLFMYEYYNDRMLEIQKHFEMKSKYKEVLSEAFYHATNCLSKRELSEWFHTVRVNYKEIDERLIFIPLTKQIITLLPKNKLLLEHLSYLIYHYTFEWDFYKAQNLIDKALKIIEKTDEKYMFIYAKLLRSRAWIISKQSGDLLLAENLIHKSINILSEEGIENNSKELARCYNQLGLNYNIQNHYEESNAAYKRAIEIQKNLKIEKDKTIGKYYNNLCSSYIRQEKVEESINMAKLALHHSEEITNNDPSLVSLSNLGRSYHLNGEIDKAKKIFINVLKKKKEIYKPNHSILSGTYFDLGKIHYDMKDFEQSVIYFEKALEIRKQYLDKVHPGVGEILIFYTRTLFKLEKMDEAIKHLLLVQHIALTVPGLSINNIKLLIENLEFANVKYKAKELKSLIQ